MKDREEKKLALLATQNLYLVYEDGTEHFAGKQEELIEAINKGYNIQDRYPDILYDHVKTITKKIERRINYFQEFLKQEFPKIYTLDKQINESETTIISFLQKSLDGINLQDGE